MDEKSPLLRDDTNGGARNSSARGTADRDERGGLLPEHADDDDDDGNGCTVVPSPNGLRHRHHHHSRSHSIADRIEEVIENIEEVVEEVIEEVKEVFAEDIQPIKPREEGDHARKLSALALAVLVFYKVSGGPFGCEPSVKAAGPFYALLGFLIFPIVWVMPEAMVTAELGSAFPEPSVCNGICFIGTLQPLRRALLDMDLQHSFLPFFNGGGCIENDILRVLLRGWRKHLEARRGYCVDIFTGFQEQLTMPSTRHYFSNTSPSTQNWSLAATFSGSSSAWP
jgi:hypothetical protein